MNEQQKKYLKYGIITVIVLLIILAIIWYRNVRKKKEEELAKNNTNTGTSTTIPTNTTTPTNNTGKTAYVKTTPAKFYNVSTFDDGDYTIAYTKNIIGEFAGTITADKTNYGSTAFYKVMNTSGNQLYILKSSVTVK